MMATKKDVLPGGEEKVSHDKNDLCCIAQSQFLILTIIHLQSAILNELDSSIWLADTASIKGARKFMVVLPR